MIKAPVITNNAPINLTAERGDVTIEGAGFLYVANGTGAVGTAPITVVAADGKIDAESGGIGDGQVISLGTVTLHAEHDVTLESALAGLQIGTGTSGVGSLMLTADSGAIRMSGVDSKGQVALTAATGVSVAEESIKASGSITIDGGSGPVAIARVGDSAATAAIETSGNAGSIAVRTAGAVTVDGSLRSANGRIAIGTQGAQVASLSMGSKAVLQAGGTGGDVSVQSSGGVLLNGVSADGAVNVSGLTVSNRGSSIVAVGDVTIAATGTGANTIDLQGIDGPDPNAAGIESNGSGSVAVRTQGGVNLNNGIRTASGDISIGTDAARVSSLTTSSNSVLQTGGAGDVSVHSNGEVALHGVTAGGDAAIDGVKIGNSGKSIVAGGNVTLTAGQGGVTLECIGVAPSCASAIDSKGTATLSTSGEVMLSSGITAVGSIGIGSSGARVASLSANAAIQAGVDASSSSSIAIFTTGDVSAQDMILGRGGSLLIDSDDPGNVADAVTLNRELGGFMDSNASSVGAGIGSLRVAADGAVTLHGVTANGLTNVTDIDISGSMISNTGKSMITQGSGNESGESVRLEASSSADGAINLVVGPGTAGIDSQGSGSVVLATRGGVDLDGGIRTAGGDIAIGNSVTRTASLALRPGVVLQTASVGVAAIGCN